LSHPLAELLQPRSIAVVGASNNPHSAGNNFTAALLKYGFKGKIFPVNPKYSEILGLKAYPEVKAIPDPVDYVISAVSAPLVPALLNDCGEKGVRIVHLFTARFGETGRPEAAELEQKILQLARHWNIRLIGPNCMGLFYPGQGISFSDAMPEEKAGPIGLISQSGQAVEEIVRSAAVMGLYFSKAISYGNALDFNECDFLDYLAQDPETRIILMYVEGLREGRRFLNSLRLASTKKPVVLLKGGRGQSGARAVASHTASLAGSSEVLSTALTQAGAVSVFSMEEMIDQALAFHYLKPFTGLRIGVLGGAGGASVLAADQCEAAGLDVIPIPQELRQALKEKGVSIWDWIGNPVDHSIREGDDFKPRQMLSMMAQDPHFDLLMIMFGEPHHERQRGITADDYLEEYRLEEYRHKPILTVVPDRCLGIDHYADWNWKVIYEIRTKLLQRAIPFYPSIERAARAARKTSDYYRIREALLGQR
jgi:acyl-CoA synthetase (NDP forming)